MTSEMLKKKKPNNWNLEIDNLPQMGDAIYFRNQMKIFFTLTIETKPY